MTKQTTSKVYMVSKWKYLDSIHATQFKGIVLLYLVSSWSCLLQRILSEHRKRYFSAFIMFQQVKVYSSQMECLSNIYLLTQKEFIGVRLFCNDAIRPWSHSVHCSSSLKWELRKKTKKTENGKDARKKIGIYMIQKNKLKLIICQLNS